MNIYGEMRLEWVENALIMCEFALFLLVGNQFIPNFVVPLGREIPRAER